ncbi:hypothetical protein TNCV_3382971 [Trichonephila clavipes]|nr:hypothetical protein TNCV_3382971 [Trichonephila clavipes]
MVERLHRTLKQAIRCRDTKWTESLPMVLLRMRVYIKEDLNASCAEMVVEGLKPSLTAPYQRPFEVSSRTDKHFTIKINDRTSTMSIDRLKQAFLLNDTDLTKEPFPGQKSNHPVVLPPRRSKCAMPDTTRRNIRFKPKFGAPRTRFEAVKPSLPALFPSRPRDVTPVSSSSTALLLQLPPAEGVNSDIGPSFFNISPRFWV